MSGMESNMFKKKPVKIILSDTTSKPCDPNKFEVKKVTNTLKVKVGDHVDEHIVSDWIKNHDNWTIEFIR